MEPSWIIKSNTASFMGLSQTDSPRLRMRRMVAATAAVLACLLVGILSYHKIGTNSTSHPPNVDTSASVPTEVKEPGWTYTSAKDPLKNSHVFRVTGMRDASGCHFTVTGTDRPGDPVKITRQIAVNSITCEADFETGDAPLSSVVAEESYPPAPPITEAPHG